MATDKKNQALELQLKKAQLRNALIITAFVLLLPTGFLLGMNKQRKAKQELAAQNVLIQQQSEKLKTLDTAKSHFFANVSHELRTPLTLLLGPIKTLLKENQLTEKQSRLIQTAYQSGKELQQLVNEIRDLQKLEMGKMELYEKPTQLSLFFNRYAAQFESLAYRKKIDFSIETTVDDEVMANIDQEKCRQIIYNLLSNAFKFTPSDGKINVEIGIRDEERGMRDVPRIPQLPQLQIPVHDSGPGIYPDDLPHVFDRFFQTTRPEKPAEGGTGIGLALCHEYAHLFGGKIEVDSTLGKGTIMRVIFPVKVLDSPKSAVGSQQSAARSPQSDDVGIAAIAPLEKENVPNPAISSEAKPTILVVEDNPGLQDYIRLVLEEKYHVITAGNGQEALKLIRDEERGMRDDAAPIPHPSSLIPDLILSDLMMPVMDGYQLLEKLKSDDATRHIPVIMLTARAEAKDKLKALRIGVDDYMTKPFDEEELMVRIENLLRNQAARRQEIPTAPEQVVAAPHMSEADRTWLENFEAHAQKNLSDDAFNIPLLAQEFAMSHSTLLRQLKRLTGLTPVQYLQEMRLDHARHLLETRSHDSIAKVASEVGYADTRSFSRSFKQRFGKLPSDYLSD
ncbi:MAG: response regulator [Saprospiraceae bacterium]|nr:response regulator [Saprospiraceae bacterium]